MYIDKRLREHNLLQTIARVNRVTKNKHCGFIVDYIGLANHLMEALSIYSDEDAEDIQQGLKNRLTELPILEERYQRLLQHFRTAGVAEIEAFVKGELQSPEADVAVVHTAVGAMQDIKRRADFEVYLNKFLQRRCSMSTLSTRGLIPRFHLLNCCRMTSSPICRSIRMVARRRRRREYPCSRPRVNLG